MKAPEGSMTWLRVLAVVLAPWVAARCAPRIVLGAGPVSALPVVRSAPLVVHPRPAPPRGKPIAGACPVESMSCYPGCAMVGDTYACGAALVTLAGGMAAAIVVLATAEGLSLEDFCNKHGVLCAKAEPKAQPRLFEDDTDCELMGVGGGGAKSRTPLACRFRCNDRLIIMILPEGKIECPGDGGEPRVKWLNIKTWLIKSI